MSSRHQRKTTTSKIQVPIKNFKFLASRSPYSAVSYFASRWYLKEVFFHIFKINKSRERADGRDEREEGFSGTNTSQWPLIYLSHALVCLLNAKFN
jgi:hypothetical protein